MSKKTVGVIGAGPAGIAIVKELKQAGLEPTAFERKETVGGHWAKDNENCGVWDELCLNGSRRWMEYSDFPWEQNTVPNYGKDDFLGLFPHHKEFNEYLDAYAKHFDLLPHIQLKTNVVQATQNKENDGWTVITKSVNDGEETTRVFDALVVCSGIYCKQHHPLSETVFKDYTGKLIHAGQFKSIHDYKDLSVLVVGSVVSGPEISTVLATHGECTKVCNSIRHVPYYIPRYSPVNFKTYDDILFSRFPAWLSRYLPESMVMSGFKSTLLENFPQQLSKGKHCFDDPDPDVTVAHVAVSANYLERIEDETLQLVPDIASAQNKTVKFIDGTCQDFDVVICATGYGPDITFLPSDICDKVLYKGGNDKHELELYCHCLVPEVDNLFFSGVSTVIGGFCPVVEMQGRLIAAVLGGTVPRPPVDKMKRIAQAERQHRESNKFKQYKNAVFLMEEIGDNLGLTPSFFTALWNPTKLLFSPCYPVQYRMDPKREGKEAAAKARERFERYLANPLVVKM